MSFLKNKFVVIVIIAILLGGATGLYLSKMNKSQTPNIDKSQTLNMNISSGSGTDAQKVGEVMQKLDNLTNE